MEWWLEYLNRLTGLYFVATDLEGRYRHVNKGFARGFAPGGDLSGQPFERTVCAEDVPVALEAATRALAHPGTPVEARLRKPHVSGTVRHTVWYFVKPPDYDGLYCLGHDISVEERLPDFMRLYREFGALRAQAPEEVPALLRAALSRLTREVPLLRELQLEVRGGQRLGAVGEEAAPPDAAPQAAELPDSAPPEQPRAEWLEGAPARAALRAAGMDPAPLAVELSTGRGTRLRGAGRRPAGDLTALDWASLALLPALAERLEDEARLHGRLTQSEALLSAVLDHLPQGVSLVDEGGRLLYLNRALTQMLGPGARVGERAEALVHPEDQAAAREAGQRSARGEGVVPSVQRWRGPDGEYLEVEVLTLTAVNPAGDTPVQLRLSRDLSEPRRHRAQLQFMVNHDLLTGLLTRQALHAEIERQLAEHGGRAGVIIVALDGFPLVNEAFGHETGDWVLQRVSARLRRAAPEGTLMARIGSAEFALLLPGLEEPAHVAADLLSRVQQPMTVEGVTIPVQCSVGTACAPEDGPGVDELLRVASAALRLNRRREDGHPRFTVRDPAATRRHLALAAELPGAIERGELRAYFQPIEHLPSGEVRWYEALVRWEHPVRGLLGAPQVVELAEDQQLSAVLDRAVLHQALAHAAAADCSVSVNLGVASLLHHDCPAIVAGALAEAGLPPERLMVEVTEHALIDKDGPVIAHLRTLRHAGVQVAIDDFGSGYASLTALKHLPVGVLKLDGQLIAGLPGDPRDEALTRSALLMGRALGLPVVAEGVQRPSQRDWLIREGVDYAQGYLIGPPEAPPPETSA